MRNHKSDARRNFQKFHKRDVERETRINFTMPKALTLLGAGAAIEYRSDKELGGRARKARLYRHVFGPNVKIYLHPNRRFLIVGGGKFRVTDWMRD